MRLPSYTSAAPSMLFQAERYQDYVAPSIAILCMPLTYLAIVTSSIQMSFDLSFYKHHILNKLGGYRDRASAALKQLDNGEFKLKIYTATAKDNAIPCVYRNRADRPHLYRTKSKEKIRHSHEIEHTLRPKPSRSSILCYDSDSDYSDCDCTPCGCGACIICT